MKDKAEYILEQLMLDCTALQICRRSMENAFVLMKNTYYSGGKVLICGNGGSASDSEHIVGELMKGFLLNRRVSEEHRKKLISAFDKDGEYLADHLQGALPAISLVSHTSLISAFINDVAPDMVFAQQVYGYGKEGDVLIALSTSGNSKNVVNAVKTAKAFGLQTIGMTGDNGGILNELCDVTIRVPACETYKIQEYHLPVYHALCAMIEYEFFDNMD